MIWRSIFDFSLPHRKDILLKSLHFYSQTVVGPGKEFGDEAEIHQIAFVYTAETMGSQAFLVLP